MFPHRTLRRGSSLVLLAALTLPAPLARAAADLEAVLRLRPDSSIAVTETFTVDGAAGRGEPFTRTLPALIERRSRLGGLSAPFAYAPRVRSLSAVDGQGRPV